MRLICSSGCIYYGSLRGVLFQVLGRHGVRWSWWRRRLVLEGGSEKQRELRFSDLYMKLGFKPNSGPPAVVGVGQEWSHIDRVLL
jgi:hypothetical protein